MTMSFIGYGEGSSGDLKKIFFFKTFNQIAAAFLPVTPEMPVIPKSAKRSEESF
jgi:hypothetical protein